MQVFGSAFRGVILALRKAPSGARSGLPSAFLASLAPEVWIEYGARTPSKKSRRHSPCGRMVPRDFGCSAPKISLTVCGLCPQTSNYPCPQGG